MLTKINRHDFPNIKMNYVMLQLIHSDLCDLNATPSIGNKKYIITFIDNYSRFCFVYLLHSKDETLDKFKIYKTKLSCNKINY